MRVTGHRGAADLAPENTLRGFRTALDHGVDSIEFDVRATADDALVVIHDGTVDRTTDGTGPVAERTLSELQALDAGDGERVPTLDAVLDLLAGTDVNLRIELKEGELGDRVVGAVTERGLAARTTVSSFDHDALAALVDAPTRLGVIIPEVTDETWATVDRLEAGALFVNLDAVDPSTVETAAARGIELGVWTVNDEAGVDRAVSLDVDSITTDRPDMVVRRLRG
jgi:glycerophosphoryl diester phosphodiesterase